MPVVSLFDDSVPDDKDKNTDSYAGGHASGMAVENPESAGFRGAVAPGPVPEGAVRITVYKNGFVIGGPDGQFRALGTPENDTFLNDLMKGNLPQELRDGDGEARHVALTDKRSEEYQQTNSSQAKPTQELYVGEGMSLSSSAGAQAVTVDKDAGKVVVDASKKKTTLQIRFPDGQRNKFEFNEDHTVADVQKVVSACMNGSAFEICSGYPPKPLTDSTLTLKDAGLLQELLTVKAK